MLPLTIGTLLAITALAYVLQPLFAGLSPVPIRRLRTAREAAGVAEQDAVVALREIEFDRATGKLSDGDYADLKSRYTAQALQAMRAGSAPVSADAIEAAVLEYRARLKSCTHCGPRPEPDAVYCSNCGHYLPGECGSCGAPVGESGAAFCATCGRQLAA